MDNVKLSQEQIDKLATNILVSDVLSYIEKNRSAYEEFLDKERKEGKPCDDRRIKTKQAMDKLELCNN